MHQGPEEAAGWERRLARGCQPLNIKLDEAQVRSFRIYRDHLLDWNPRASLISSGDESRILTRHFLDSLSLLQILDVLPGARLLDVGSGGGFPGLPVKICRPWIRIVLLEPREKRFYFLKSLIQSLGLEEVTVLRERAQEVRSNPDMEEKFDLVLARALAPQSRSVDMCLPFVRPGGLMVLYRGKWHQGEAVLISNEVAKVGGEVLAMIRVSNQEQDPARYLLLTRKKHPQER